MASSTERERPTGFCGDRRYRDMTPSIDVVVPVHNRSDLTESCLTHLRDQTVAHTVFVCDNGSTDGTPARVGAAFPEARVLELGANLGFPKACNLGARAGSGEIIVLLNNDVDCRPDFLERVVAPLQSDARIGSVASLLLKPGEERIDSFGLAADRTFAGFPRLRGCPRTAAQGTAAVLAGPLGAGGAYRRRAWESVGGLDEGVFSYGEDVDLALRIRAAGWSAAAAADAIAVHIGSASAAHRSSWQRYQGGFARGYFLRRYGVLRSRAAARAIATEAVAVLGDALAFSHDLAAFRGRVAGWRAARGLPLTARPPREAIDDDITFLDSLRLRVDVYTERERPASYGVRSASTAS
jgi:N-acetylglucosaminyl-diphospho-decaprenol L-rhamnosyltransferase